MKTNILKTVLLFVSLFFCLTLVTKAQEKNDWHFLFETGVNNVNSKKEINFGIGIEYFLFKNNSLKLRVKYLKNGIDYSKKSNGCDSFAGFFCFPSEKLKYRGTVLKIPISYNFQNKLFFNRLKFFISTGIALNITLEEEFLEIHNLTSKENKTNINFNIALGLIYELNSKIDIYAFPEAYIFGNEKSNETIGGLFSSNKAMPKETILGFGIRYKL